MIQASFISEWVFIPATPEKKEHYKCAAVNRTGIKKFATTFSAVGVGVVVTDAIVTDQSVIDAVELAGYTLLWSQTI